MTRRKRLGELVAGLPGEAVGDVATCQISGISIDSRHVRPGDLFVALPGTRTHGARHLDEALARGATAVVTPEDVQSPPVTAVFRTKDPLAALPVIAARFYDHPADALRLVGVTGTNGKTTTALLIYHLLNRQGVAAAAWTTTGVTIGRQSLRPQWTTPPAHELQRFLARAREEGVSHVVLEVSSHAIAQRRIGGLAFQTVVVTNVSPDHLDFHGDFQAYVATKAQLLTYLRPDGFALLNADDPIVGGFGQELGRRRLRFGYAAHAEIRAEEATMDLSTSRFRVVVRPSLLTAGRPLDLPVQVPLAGRHNVLNVLAAIGAGLCLGLQPEPMVDALRHFPRPPRRLEASRLGPYTVLNDVAMNEASYDTVFRTLAELGLPTPVVVHAIRGRRGVELNARIAEVLAAWNRRLHYAPLIVTLSKDRLADLPVDYSVTPEEQEAFTRAAEREGLPFALYDSLADAIEAAVARLPEGGVLVLLGTFGMDDGPALAAAAIARRFALPLEDVRRYPLPEALPPDF